MELDEYLGRTIVSETGVLWVVAELTAASQFVLLGRSEVNKGESLLIHSAPVIAGWRRMVGGKCADCEGKCEWEQYLCERCR